MADEFPFLVKGDDRQQVGRTTPYYAELVEQGYTEESGAPARSRNRSNTDTEEV